MTKRNLIARSDEAHRWYKDLVHSLRVGTVGWLAAGEFLTKLKEKNRYRDVMGEPSAGSQWAWEEFLSQPEIGLPYSTAAKLMQMYEVFRVKLTLPDGAVEGIRFYRLKAIAPHITEENKEVLLDAAEHLSRNDFEHALVKASKDIDRDTCKHEWREIVLRECETCGLRRKQPAKKP